MDFLSTAERCTAPPLIIYQLGRGVQSLRGLFIHLKGVYTSSVDDVSTGEGYTLSPCIFHPLGRGVQSLLGLFIHWGGVYCLCVDFRKSFIH